MQLPPFKKWIFLIGLLGLVACSKSSLPLAEPLISNHTYLHISHTRTDQNPEVNPQVLEIPFNNFEGVWLGGDLAQESSRDEQSLDYLNRIFQLGDSSTLWALGNHDYTRLDLVSQYTGRPPYYATSKEGLVFLVLDTQDAYNQIVGNQLALFKSVTDTIASASHLMVLHHKLFWLQGNPELEPLIDSLPNGGPGSCFYCTNPSNFYTDLYPALLEVKNRGIEVICLAGDIGFKAKSFEYQTPEGIWFLASGIEHGTFGNKALKFTYQSLQRKLTWQFVDLENIR